jgi:dGTPase
VRQPRSRPKKSPSRNQNNAPTDNGDHRLYSDGDHKRRAKPYKTSAEGQINADLRTDFRRDYARLIHSPSLRRLQGKTQLFPNARDDFVRTRLTHSLEVAQIGKSIAGIVNGNPSAFPFFTNNPIDLDLVEFSCLAHDVGHPPFGHIGEDALDECMASDGGFEGNAQTLRILSTLEKKELLAAVKPQHWSAFTPIVTRQADRRCGLNLTYRSLASVIKYDQKIPARRKRRDGPDKGYYHFDEDLVEQVRLNVLGHVVDEERKKLGLPFRTIECSIMDIADDIAYSTYDLEDSLRVDAVTPLSLLDRTRDQELMARVTATINKRIERYYPKTPEPIKMTDVELIVFKFFKTLCEEAPDETEWAKDVDDPAQQRSRYVTSVGATARRLRKSGYWRSQFTSGIIDTNLQAIELVPSDLHPALHQIRLKKDRFLEVEVLKVLNFEIVIKSSQLRMAEYRGARIIKDIFEALNSPGGDELLPSDHAELFRAFTNPSDMNRVICDFIAGMTDRFAMEFHARLRSSRY